MNPIIFLDIDGPINTIKNMRQQRYLRKSINSAFIELPRSNFMALKHIVKNTNADVVISSNWRIGSTDREPSDAYKNFCSQAVKYDIYPIGWTPIINKKYKGVEIKKWLEEYERINNSKVPYIIIEDNIDTVIKIHKGHVIYTSSYSGLNMQTASVAIRVLKKQQMELQELQNV